METTIEHKGFSVRGELTVDRLSFAFEVREIREIATGRTFETTLEVYAETCVALNSRDVATDAAVMAGYDIWTLADLDFRDSNR